MALTESRVRMMTVYELIEASFPDITTNTVNFKIMQIVLHVLANGLNLLEQDVEIRFEDEKQKVAMLQGEWQAIKDEEARRLEEKRKRLADKKAEKKVPESLWLGLRRSQQLLRAPSIQVVTASSFKLLEDMVNELMKRSGAVPLPTMPDAEEMMSEVASGTASLTGTMEAMQLNARVQAAEEALTRMARLLISVADAGGLPKNLADMVAALKRDLRRLSALAGDKTDLSIGSESGDGKPVEKSSSPRETMSAKEVYIKLKEMEAALAVCEEKLSIAVTVAVAKGTQSNAHIQQLVKKISENMKVAENLDSRITDLTSITDNSYEKLNGFADVLGGRMKEIDNQMTNIQTCTNDAIKRLRSPDCDAEHNAMKALKIEYGTLMIEMGNAELAHNAVIHLKKECEDDIKVITTVIRIMNEEKAVSAEVAAELNNKVSLLSLKGLLADTEFNTARNQLETALNICYDTFYAQEDEWVSRLKHLAALTDAKGHYRRFLEIRQFATDNFNHQRKLIQYFEKKLGSVEDAILTRKVSENGHCGPCMVPAHIAPRVARSLPPGEKPSRSPFDFEGPADLRREWSLRWVGGAHTRKPRRRPKIVIPPPALTKPYIGIGDDGRLYHMEEELQPCAECLSPPTGRTCEDGGGDTALD